MPLDHPRRCDHSRLAGRPQCSAIVYPGVRARPDDIPGGTRQRQRCDARECVGRWLMRRDDAGDPDEKCDFNDVYSIE